MIKIKILHIITFHWVGLGEELMKWYRFQTYILWPSSMVFYALIYFMSGIMRDNIDVSDIPIDTSNADEFINYLIPIKLLHNLILIYLFHIKSHLSLKFFIVSNIILVIASYLFLEFLLMYSTSCPIWFLISFIIIKEKSFLRAN